MENLAKMKECLISIVEGQIYGNLDKVDAKELGEAVDMIKDLAEAEYYCAITKAMEEGSTEEPKHTMYFTPKKANQDWRMKETNDPYERSRHEEMVRYPNNVEHIYREGMMKDPHEGRSGERRKMYMSGKGKKDKTEQMHELENYMQELTLDITGMIEDASAEEKAMLQSKLTTLASKIK